MRIFRGLTRLLLVLAALALLPACTRQRGPRALVPATGAPAPATFTNPLLPVGADPWSIYHDGYYYYTNTTGDNLTLWKTKNLADLKNAEHRVVWTPPAKGPNSGHIWAPELHFLRGKWYLYYAADAGDNPSHRLWVLENASPDPLLGTWTDRGKLADPAADMWAIDGSVFLNNGKLYLIWSGWDGRVNGRQDIYLAPMKNPWTLAGPRVRISTPTYDWERNGDLHGPNDPPHVAVNEGPEVIRHGNKLFLVYSASGCWTDFYVLGMLTANANSDLRKAASWTKTPTPVFQQSPENKVYAPGHNSFFTSPDGKENWLLYHANSAPDQGCGPKRTPRMQRFTWRPDGTPDFGQPVPAEQVLAVPSGQ
ncbi:glycoside hydrolase family 43 protein [Hymenobacter coccineus]|uniref:glycoside hydrolase family 43 protein n=1 Tax=Hymenobacter coccineus TaxID=1908235 RepID=UPI0009F68621|nr:glycoside hydrolase family 43 protein [Hymenobacter coccineus]